jgi:hypothetical protein
MNGPTGKNCTPYSVGFRADEMQQRTPTPPCVQHAFGLILHVYQNGCKIKTALVQDKRLKRQCTNSRQCDDQQEGVTYPRAYQRFGPAQYLELGQDKYAKGYIRGPSLHS